MSFYTALRELFFGATVTQPFGPTNVPGEPGGFHQGVDLLLPGGTRANVYSPASGRVVAVGTDAEHGYGLFVRILSPNGFTYLLGHMWNLRVQPGQLVSAGDLLGNQGHTGYVLPAGEAGTHLHLEIRNPLGKPVNPGSTDYPTGPRALSSIWFNLEHGLGFGYGCHPEQFTGGPPDPTAKGANPCLSTVAPHECPTGQYWDGSKCRVVGSVGNPPPRVPPGTTCTQPTDPLDVAAWAAYYACIGQQTVSSAFSLQNLFTGSSQWLPNVMVFGTGLLLIWQGLRQLERGDTPAPIRAATGAVTAPVRAAGDTAKRGVKLAATAAKVAAAA